MTVFTRRRVVALGATTIALPSSLRAQATWPTSPVTFVVGYAPWGPTRGGPILEHLPAVAADHLMSVGFSGNVGRRDVPFQGQSGHGSACQQCRHLTRC